MLLNSADQHYAQTVDQKLPEEKNNQADTNHAHCHIPVKNIGGQNQNLEGWKECFAGEWLWLCSVLSCRLIYWSDSKSDVVMFGGLVTARMGKSILSWRLFIWVMAVFRKKIARVLFRVNNRCGGCRCSFEIEYESKRICRCQSTQK